MSHRPTRVKAANRLRKSFRQVLPSYINLVDWLVDRKHARTKREARQMILDGRVKSDSHAIGRAKSDTGWVLAPLVPSGLARTIYITKASS